MLFYVKKYLWLDLAVTLTLGGLGYGGISYFNLPATFTITASAFLQGLFSFLIITIWTFTVQRGYALVKGQAFARQLTESLAKEYASASLVKAIAAGMTAALGEEIFFRGFIQQKWGLIAGSLLFGFAHYGKKDIRVVSHWSYVHGLLFGLSYNLPGNLPVLVIAHGLFDIGGVIYFRRIMRDKPS